MTEWKTNDYCPGSSFEYLLITNSDDITQKTVRFLLNWNEYHNKGIKINLYESNTQQHMNATLIIIIIPNQKPVSVLWSAINENKFKQIILCNNFDDISTEFKQFVSNNKSKLFHCHLFQSDNFRKRDRNLDIFNISQFNKNNVLLSPLNAYNDNGIACIDIKYILNKAFKYFGDMQYDYAEYEWLISKNHNQNHHKYNIYIIRITLNNGSVHVLSNNLVLKLLEIFHKFENKLSYKHLRGYILTSNTTKRILKNKKPIFSAGLDISLFNKNTSLLFKLKYFRNLRQLSYVFHTLKRPIIAAINGSCIAGGTELAIKCDYRIMFKNCYMQYNEAKNKIAFNSFPDTLNRVINNEDKLSFIFQTSLPFYGYDAKDIGFVNDIVDSNNEQELINKCLDVLENKYLCLSDPATAAQIRSVLRQKYINLTKHDVQQQDKKIKMELKRLQNSKL